MTASGIAVRCAKEHADMVRQELVTMSTAEIDRAGIVTQLLVRRLSQARAASQLGITPRQVRQLLVRHGADGPAGLVSKKRGGVGNRSKLDELKARVLKIVRALRYAPALKLALFIRPIPCARRTTRSSRQRVRGILRGTRVEESGRRR